MSVRVNLEHQAAARAVAMMDVIGKPCTKKGKPSTVDATDSANLVTKCLGVLQEDGMFAATVFLLYRSGREVQGDKMSGEEATACWVLKELMNMPHEGVLAGIQQKMANPLVLAQVNARKSDIIKHALRLTETSLDELLLIRQVWEQSLTYARYIARAQRSEKGRNADERVAPV